MHIAKKHAGLRLIEERTYLGIPSHSLGPTASLSKVLWISLCYANSHFIRALKLNDLWYHFITMRTRIISIVLAFTFNTEDSTLPMEGTQWIFIRLGLITREIWRSHLQYDFLWENLSFLSVITEGKTLSIYYYQRFTETLNSWALATLIIITAHGWILLCSLFIEKACRNA